MINTADFKKIRDELSEHESRRDEQMQLSRDIITKSKEIIYALHRDDMTTAQRAVGEIKAHILELPEKPDSPMVEVAWQEYVEAMTYYIFLTEKRLATRDDLGVESYAYLMGLCDLTGELLRKGIKAVIDKDYALFEQIHALVEGIYGEFLYLELRDNEIRRKADSIKYALKKLEEVRYDLSMKTFNDPSLRSGS